MKVTIIVDNTAHLPGLKKQWGFSCLVETGDAGPILFDTGMTSGVLLHNMEKLGIDPAKIERVFISHSHLDHTGGARGFGKRNPDTVMYVPGSCFSLLKPRAGEIVRVEGAVEIRPNVFSTGVLKGKEQSLAVRTERGIAVIAGCSHPGVGEILRAASEFGKPVALIGGLHGFREFDLLRDLELICATHCTRHSGKIRELYPDSFVQGGAGREITI